MLLVIIFANNHFIDLADIQGDFILPSGVVLHVVHYYARFMLVVVRTQ